MSCHSHSRHSKRKDSLGVSLRTNIGMKSLARGVAHFLLCAKAETDRDKLTFLIPGKRAKKGVGLSIWEFQFAAGGLSNVCQRRGYAKTTMDRQRDRWAQQVALSYHVYATCAVIYVYRCRNSVPTRRQIVHTAFRIIQRERERESLCFKSCVYKQDLQPHHGVVRTRESSLADAPWLWHFCETIHPKAYHTRGPSLQRLNPINRQCLPASLNNAYNSGYTRKNKVSPNIFNITMIRNKNRCFLI